MEAFRVRANVHRARKFAVLRDALAYSKPELNIALEDRTGYGIAYIHHPTCIEMSKESIPLRTVFPLFVS